MKGFNSLVRMIEVATPTLLGLCIGAVFVNAVLRYGFDGGLVFTEEASRIAIVWIVFFGAIAALVGLKRLFTGRSRVAATEPADQEPD